MLVDCILGILASLGLVLGTNAIYVRDWTRFGLSLLVCAGTGGWLLKRILDGAPAKKPTVLPLVLMGVLTSLPLAAAQTPPAALTQPARADLHKEFHVTLPAEARPFPEPLAPGKPPGFKFRGTKGWAWTPEQYLAEIPWLAKFKLNFLMTCYLSMFDLEHHPKWSDGEANRWWEDLPAEKKAAYAKVIQSCRDHGIQFCFGMNPNFFSKRMVNDESPESVESALQALRLGAGPGCQMVQCLAR